MQSIEAFWKRSCLLAVVVAAVLGFSRPAFAEEIVVVGNTRGDADMIRSYFAGTGPQEVEQGLQALRNSGRFANVSATREQGRLVIRVSESSLINRVVFEGNSKVKTETLTSEVRTRSHGAFNKTVIDQDIARLLEIYKRSGRAGAKITYRVVELPNGRIDVVFTVDEGEKTGVKVASSS
jgi:outer membrane protein insertion porin family